MNKIFVSYQTNKKLIFNNKSLPFQRKLQTLKSSFHMLVLNKELKKKYRSSYTRQSKALKENAIMVKLMKCTLYHQQDNNLKKFFKKFLLMKNTLKWQLRLKSKVSMRFLLIKSMKKKALNKIGSKCVSLDGHGSDKLCHTTHLLMLRQYQVKPCNMENKAFQNPRIVYLKLFKNNIWIAVLNTRSQWFHYLLQHGSNFFSVWISKIICSTLIWTQILKHSMKN